MAHKMAKRDVELFVSLVPSIIEGSLSHANEQIVASAIVCLATFVQELGPRAVPHLPKFFPIIMAQFENGIGQSEIMTLSCLSALEVMVQTLAQFISPYMGRILACLLRPQLNQATFSHDAQSQIREKINALVKGITTQVAPRLLLPALVEQIVTCMAAGAQSLTTYFTLVSKFIEALEKEAIMGHHMQLFKLFVVSFNFRNTLSRDLYTLDQITAVENSVLDSFYSFVMKLNEKMFKPLFLKLADWATSDLLLKNGFTALEVENRCLVFYRLLDLMLTKLKSIFAPYYSFVFDHAVAKLTENTDATPLNVELWKNVVLSLTKFLTYDNDNAFNQERYDKVLQPLVDQMDVAVGVSKDDHAEYLTRMRTYLVPCFGAMAINLGNDASWKQMNYQVLMKSRCEAPEVRPQTHPVYPLEGPNSSPFSPKIRLISLRILQEFYTRLGEEFLALLPETIPFLAELMEDDDFEVEKLCQNVCQLIQQYLGEDLTKYFN